MIEIDCAQCGGEGGFDVGPTCRAGGACDSCGGCYDSVQCELCEGAGVLLVEACNECAEPEDDCECVRCADCGEALPFVDSQCTVREALIALDRQRSEHSDCEVARL
jgi:hypothetical protein